MNNLTIQFTLDDGVAMLKNLGLEVAFREMPVPFPARHGSADSVIEMIPMWTVTNPHTGKVQPVRPLFQKYLNRLKHGFLLNPQKLDIISLFEMKEE